MKIAPPKMRRGFTLVELVITMLISAMLIASIMFQADSVIKSTQTTVSRQNEVIKHDAFFTLMRKHFEGLPGNCRMELTFSERGEQYLSEMTFQNVPVAFNWGGVSIAAEAMRIRTLPLQDGELNIILEYFDEPILDSDESLAERGIEPAATITLLEGLRLFEWRVLDGRSSEWEWEWDIRGRRPTQVELNVAFGQNGEVIRRIFWIPTRANPASIMRGFQGQAPTPTPNPNPTPNPSTPPTPTPDINPGG